MSDTQNALQLLLTPRSRTILVQCNYLSQNLDVCNYRIKWSSSGRLLGDIYESNVQKGNMTDTIWGLKPCTEYKVEVIPLSQENKPITAPKNKEIRTLPEEPPNFRKIGFGATRSDSVTVKWQLADTRCQDTSFHLIYSGRKLWGEGDIHTESFSFEDKMMENKLQIQNLHPYSSYELCVTAKNSAGTGTTSCTFVETSEGKPSAPVGLSAVWMGSTSVTLTWQEPQHVRGVVRHYTVTWATKSVMGNKKSLNFGLIRQEKTTERTYTIAGLTDEEDYTVEVTASTGAGEGEAAKMDISTGAGQGETARIDVSTGAGEGEAAKIDVSTGAGEGEAAKIDVSTGAGQRETARIDVSTGAGQEKEADKQTKTRPRENPMTPSQYTYSDINVEAFRFAEDIFNVAPNLNSVHTLMHLTLAMIAVIFQYHYN